MSVKFEQQVPHPANSINDQYGQLRNSLYIRNDDGGVSLNPYAIITGGIDFEKVRAAGHLELTHYGLNVFLLLLHEDFNRKMQFTSYKAFSEKGLLLELMRTPIFKSVKPENTFQNNAQLVLEKSGTLNDKLNIPVSLDVYNQVAGPDMQLSHAIAFALVLFLIVRNDKGDIRISLDPALIKEAIDRICLLNAKKEDFSFTFDQAQSYLRILVGLCGTWYGEVDSLFTGFKSKEKNQ